MSWRKRHTGFAGNPKIMAACLDAGPIAALLYDLLLDRHAEKSARDGRLAAHDVDAHSLLRVLSNFLPRGEVLEIKQVEGAFSALVEVGLLTRDGQGARISGWSRSWDDGGSEILSEHCVVYAIRNPSTRLVKIGTSGRLNSRLATLRRKHGPQLELVRTVPGSYPEERALHDRFAEWRVHGEWFADDGDVQLFADGRVD